MNSQSKLMDMLIGYASAHQHPFNVAVHMIGIPTIITASERREMGDDNASLALAGGAVATAFGGMFTLFGIVILPSGISNLVRARGGMAFNRTPRGTWTAGVRLRF